MKTKILILTFFLGTYLQGQCQQNSQGFTPQVIPPSPNAASIGKFGDIPISYYTGTASISSPLYTVTEGKIQVPISLNYHPSGIKVADEASQVGLGWALNAGGVVSRTVMGEDDFEAQKYFSTQHPLPLNHIPLELIQVGVTVPNQQQLSNYKILNPQNQVLDYPLYTEQGFPSEYEPDHFSFSFPGGGGKFFITRDKKVLMEEKSDIIVKMIEDPALASADDGLNISWEITTTDGTKYIFDEIETYYIPASNVPKRHVSSWFLKKIKPYTGLEVNFEYQKILNAKNYPQGSISETVEAYKFGTECNNLDQPSSGISPSAPVRAPAKYMETVYLDKIIFSNGHVKFNYGDREDLFWDKKLENVEVYRNAVPGPELHKRMTLNYSYFDCDLDADFVGTSEGSISKRLKLLSIDEVVPTGENIRQFEYEYYEGQYNTILPAKTSFAIDHWGYFNGRSSNTSLIPKFDNYVSTEPLAYYYGIMTGNERNADPTYSKAYSLKKIKYPTGGYTQLDYESHDYDIVKSKENDNSLGRNLPIVENELEYRNYDTKKKNQQLDLHVDISKAVVAENSTTTILKLKTYLRFNTSIPCTAANQSGLVTFELINTDNNTSYGTYDMLTMPECVGGDANACVKRNCVNDSISGISFSTTLNLHVGHYAWRVKAGDGQDFSFADFTAAFSWYQPKTANPGAKDYAGGIRLKKIEDYDGAQKTVKNFSYTVKETIEGQEVTRSSGRLMTMPQYTYSDQKWCVSNTIAGNYFYSTTHIFRSSNSIIPLNGSASGSIVGYDRVEVTYGENGEFGKSVYLYDNQSDKVNNYGYFRTPTIASVPYIGNGLLLKQEDYKIVGQNYSKVKEVVNQYYLGLQFNIPTQAPFLYAAETRPYPLLIAGSVQSMKIHAFFYPLVTEKYKYLQSTTERVYDSINGSTFTENTTSTIYPSPIYNAGINSFEKTYFQPEYIVTTNSQKEQVKKEIKYPYNFNSQPYIALTNANIISTPIEEKTILKNRQVSKKTTNYDTFGSFILPKNVITQRLSTDALFNEITFNTYNEIGNITSYTERNGIITNIDYFGSNDIGKINLVKSKTVNGDGLIQVNQYDYLPLVGLIRIIQPNGLQNTYEYDSFYRLKAIKDDKGNILKSYKYNYVTQQQ